MGRLSISIHSTHDDPMGLGHLHELNSAASNDISSAWAAAIPKFVARRGAIVGAAGAFGLRRSSLDSEISMSAVRRISLESTTQRGGPGHSRRHSFDSQYSIQSQQTTDLERLTRLHFRKGGRSGKRSTAFRAGRKMALRRRGSVTSQASSIQSRGSQILPAITKLALKTTRRGSITSLASSSKNGSQILPAITTKRRRDQIMPVGRGVGTSTAVDVAAMESGTNKRGPDLSERIERFSLNLPGDASSDESDLEQQRKEEAAIDIKVTQSTQTIQTWNAATQTTPSLSACRALTSKTTTAKTTMSQSKGTQMTSSSSSSISSASSSPEVVRKSFPKSVTPAAIGPSSSKCITNTHRERGQADGSPNGTSESDDEDLSDNQGGTNGGASGGAALNSPSQSLLNYLLPIKADKKVEDRHRNGSSKSRSQRTRSGRAVEAIELDRSSIARLLEKLRDEEKGTDAAPVDSPKRSFDRRNRSERNRRSHSERDAAGSNEMELDCLLSSKNSNRSDRSKKSENRRSRSKQETSAAMLDGDDDVA